MAGDRWEQGSVGELQTANNKDGTANGGRQMMLHLKVVDGWTAFHGWQPDFLPSDDVLGKFLKWTLHMSV